MTWWQLEELARRLSAALPTQLELGYEGTDGAVLSSCGASEPGFPAPGSGAGTYGTSTQEPSERLSYAVGPSARLGAAPGPSKTPEHDQGAQGRRRRQDEARAERYYRELIEPYPSVDDPLWAILYSPGGIFPGGRGLPNGRPI